MKLNKRWTEWLWDAWCILSGIGIWPRYIEPRLLEVNEHLIPIPKLPKELLGLKILQFSDLHWNRHFSKLLRKKLIKKINALKPDLIVFTGDFLCRSTLENSSELLDTLNALKSRLGNYAILGNHDYAQFVTVNQQGNYDVEKPSATSNIMKGFKRLFQPISLKDHVTEQARRVNYHDGLITLLKNSSFQLLNNRTKQVSCNGYPLNICGLEEYSLGKFDPIAAFADYDVRYPGIVLSHNPDTIPKLTSFPGDFILSGHTHGGQVNLPGMWRRFTRIKYPEFKQGLKKIGQKWIYVNRGISSVMKFRWFAAPELTLFILQRG